MPVMCKELVSLSDFFAVYFFSSADPALVTEKDEEISKLKKSLESWKTDAKKFEERLLASNAKNAVSGATAFVFENVKGDTGSLILRFFSPLLLLQ